jgi:hypothetical protein
MTAILLALALLMNCGGNSAGQNAHTSPSNTQKELFLTPANDGQRVSAKVGQSIAVTLQTIGEGAYSTSQRSSPVIRFDSAKYLPPREQNPGGPKQVYRFTATAEGAAQIRIPHRFKPHGYVYDSGHKTTTDWRVLASN